MDIFIDYNSGKRVFGLTASNGDKGIETLYKGDDMVFRVFWVLAIAPGLVPTQGLRWEAKYPSPTTMPTVDIWVTHSPADGSTREVLSEDEEGTPTDKSETVPFATEYVEVIQPLQAAEPLTSLIGELPSIPAQIELQWVDGTTTRSLHIPARVLNTIRT